MAWSVYKTSLYCALSIASCTVSNTTAVIEMDTSPRGFVLSYTLVGDPGGRHTAPIHSIVGRYRPRPDEHVFEFWNITTVENDHLIIPGLNPDGNGEIRIAFGTQFAARYMLIPMNRKLVVNPHNPLDYIQGGTLVTTRSINDVFAEVRVSVSILNAHQDQDMGVVTSLSAGSPTYDFSIAPGITDDFLPASVMQDLFSELQRRRIPSTPSYRAGSIYALSLTGDLNEDIIESLPTIQYHIHTDSGVIIQLYGRDYVGSRSTPFGRRLSLSAHATRGYFGQTTLSKIALFVDNHNRRIGFGEPF